jgi:hypothetical protein
MNGIFGATRYSKMNSTQFKQPISNSLVIHIRRVLCVCVCVCVYMHVHKAAYQRIYIDIYIDNFVYDASR